MYGAVHNYAKRSHTDNMCIGILIVVLKIYTLDREKEICLEFSSF